MGIRLKIREKRNKLPTKLSRSYSCSLAKLKILQIKESNTFCVNTCVRCGFSCTYAMSTAAITAQYLQLFVFFYVFLEFILDNFWGSFRLSDKYPHFNCLFWILFRRFLDESIWQFNCGYDSLLLNFFVVLFLTYFWEFLFGILSYEVFSAFHVRYFFNTFQFFGTKSLYYQFFVIFLTYAFRNKIVWR